jgi:serine-threonine kinase receptor-associated protein
VRFFDTSSLSLIKQQELAHNAEAASYCPQFKRFVAGGEDMWVHLYDFDSGEVSQSFINIASHLFSCMA